MRKITSYVCVACVGLVLAAGATSAAVPTPVLQYLFNETGVYATNTGSLAGGDLLMKTQDRIDPLHPITEVDLHSVDGGGLTGEAGDRNFNNYDQWRGTAQMTEDMNELDNLQSFTIAGWYRTDTKPSTTENWRFASKQGFDLLTMAADVATSKFQLRLSIAGTKANASYNSNLATYAYDNTWVFFAVTWDGSDPYNPGTFYVGSENNAVTAAGGGTTTTDLGVTGDFAAKFTVGNTFGSLGRPALANMDDIAMWTTKSGGAGALNAAQLEEYRQSTLNPVPEPGSLAMLGTSVLGCGLAIIRRRKQ